MKQKIFFVFFLFWLCANGFTQTKAKIKFTSINQFGVLTGESPTEFQLQTINGLGYKSFMAGIGFGLDDYYETTLPLFVDVRKSFLNNTSSPFLYGDVGYSFLAQKSTTQREMDRKGGIYYGVGIGYEFPVNQKVKALIDIGYCYKHFSKIIDNEPWRSSLHNFDTYDYSLNRISVKAGLRF